MRRWIAIASIVFCAGVLYVLVSDALAERAERKREVMFREILLSYQQRLKPGMTREQVEQYLQLKGVEFRRSCCINNDNRAADLVNIWEGAKPWYCSENTEYVAFQFTAPSTVSPDPKDVLDKVALFQWLGGCL